MAISTSFLVIGLCLFLLFLVDFRCSHSLRYAFQEMEATVVDGNGTETGHIIVTTIGGRNGQPKQV